MTNPVTTAIIGKTKVSIYIFFREYRLLDNILYNFLKTANITIYNMLQYSQMSKTLNL